MSFLSTNQPLPPDRELSSEVAGELDSVRKWLSDHPIPQALPMLLRVFGEGDGLGVYPMIEHTIARYPHDAIVAELATVLNDAPSATRYWALQLAAAFPDQRMVKAIGDLLPVLDHDSRYAALTALEAIGGDEVLDYVAEWAKKETDPDLRDLMSDILLG